ncbi:hypothetical protein V3C99_015772 [Haemonchus contortus]|uniref:Fibronectin type-III domain-containing protein n=1 Tax=Haemonchus contortus TaxID=6289 RepID=A0A7I4YVV9_HAECO
MRLQPRTMMKCFLWCYAIVIHLSLAEEGEREEPLYCYINPDWSVDYGEIAEAEDFLCVVWVRFEVMNGTITSPEFRYYFDWRFSPESENPLGCELLDSEYELWNSKEEKDFLQYNGGAHALCFCNQSPICATQPETFESILNTQRSSLPFYATKAAEIVLEFMREGKLPNNATEALEEFKATSSTPTSTIEATITEVSTTTETATATETTTTASSTSPTETTTTAETATATETTTTASSTSPTGTTTTEISTTATSASSTETSTTFATTSYFEYWDASTTSAYDDSSTETDTISSSISEAEVAGLQQMDSFLGQYGLVIAVAVGILILVIVIIVYKMRKGKANEDLEGAIGKGGTSKSKESKGTSKEGSKESKTSKTKESGSKEKKTGSKD